jgi:hypothetical protein
MHRAIFTPSIGDTDVPLVSLISSRTGGRKVRSFSCLTFAALLLALAATSDAAVILNGSFENGQADDGSPNNYMTVTANSTTGVTNWTVGPNQLAFYWKNNGSDAQQGTRWINFADPGPSFLSISQSFAVNNNYQYTVSYYERERVNPGNALQASISLASGSATGTLSQTANNQTTTWALFTFTFVSHADTTATLTFAGGGTTYNLGDPPYYGTGLDNVSLSEIALPEPSSLVACIGASVIGLNATRRFRH